MAGAYVTKADGLILKADPRAVQSFHHRFASDRTHNESFTIRWFCDLSPEKKDWYTEVMILLSRFTFATKENILEFMRIRGYDVADADEYLDELLVRRCLNSFYMSETQDEETSEGKNFPEDAYVVYCLDLCARQVLVRFFREDMIYWRLTDCYRNTGQIMKYLSTCQFYLALLDVKRDRLRRFDAPYDALIGRRTSRYSAFLEVSDGDPVPRNFVLESVRKADIPTYWEKKVMEQMIPYVDRGYWRQSFVDAPYFVLLAEDMEVATAAAEALSRRLPKLRYCVTTDQELLKGLANATFYRFAYPDVSDPNEITLESNGELIPVKASIFTKYGKS